MNPWRWSKALTKACSVLGGFAVSVGQQGSIQHLSASILFRRASFRQNPILQTTQDT